MPQLSATDAVLVAALLIKRKSATQVARSALWVQVFLVAYPMRLIPMTAHVLSALHTMSTPTSASAMLVTAGMPQMAILDAVFVGRVRLRAPLQMRNARPVPLDLRLGVM